MLDELQRIEEYKKVNPNELTAKQFKNLEHEIKYPDPKVMSDEYVDFELWLRGEPSRQERFARFIVKKLRKGSKILEVGGGRTGRLSRILSEEGFIMTCMDPKLEMESTEKVEFIKGVFNYKRTDLSNYDYVIAQEPCEATEHIIRACVKQKKPFIIIPCGVPHKLISGKTPKDVNEWYEYLINIDSKGIKLRYLKWDSFSITPMIRSNIL